jgi:hypothetical protein
MKHFFIVATMVAAMAGAHAQTIQSAHTDGQQLGKSLLDRESKRVSGGKLNGKDAITDLPFYNENPPQKQGYTSGSIFTLGASRISSCKNYVPGTDKIANQECEAVNFLASNPNPANRFDLTNDPAVLAGRVIASNAAAMNQVVGESACLPKTTTTPAETAIKTCSEYVDPFEDQCPVFRVVQKQPQTNYMCDVTYQAKETATCDRRLSLTCDRPASCGFGGVVGIPFGDMTTSTSTLADGQYAIEFGTIGDNYWSGDIQTGQAYDRTLYVDLQDVTAVNTFAITRAKFDDWLLISVNGTVVYVGPKGGDRLEQVFTYGAVYKTADGIECTQDSESYSYTCRKNMGEVWSGDGYSINWQVVGTHYYCESTGIEWRCDGQSRIQIGPNWFFDSAELATNWDFTLNIDIRPYLKNGQNTIFTRTIVANKGENYIRFITQMSCPLNCKDVWEDHCGAYEERTKP